MINNIILHCVAYRCILPPGWGALPNRNHIFHLSYNPGAKSNESPILFKKLEGGSWKWASLHSWCFNQINQINLVNRLFDFRLPTDNCRLMTADCPLSTDDCQLDLTQPNSSFINSILHSSFFIHHSIKIRYVFIQSPAEHPELIKFQGIILLKIDPEQVFQLQVTELFFCGAVSQLSHNGRVDRNTDEFIF